MVDIEDLKIYFYDSFLSNFQFVEDTAGTAYINYFPTELFLHGGVTSGSYARLNYDRLAFNPKYSEFVTKLRFNSKDDIIAFFGFKSTLNAPTDPMIETHAGILIKDNKIYFTTADGDTQQKVQIQTIDVTKVYEYKIKNNELWYKPLPQVETYLGLPTIQRVERKWTFVQANTNYPPEDQVHYLFFYIQNLSIAQKILYINRVIYKEEYAD